MRRLILTLVVFFAAIGMAKALDNPRTQTYLQNNEFQDGQAPGSITPQYVRDFIVSTMQGNAYRVVQYGTAGTPVCSGSDDTAAINAAASAANANGGGIVAFPPGTCLSSQFTIYPGVYYVGAGRDATFVKLNNSANATLALGANYATLTGTNSTAGTGGWGMMGLTLDGNKANNSSGACMQVYGYGFEIVDVSIRNCAGDGMDTEWSSSASCPTNGPPDCMEAFFSNVLIHDFAGGSGWQFKGPHDSQVNRMIIWTYSNPAAKGLYLTAATAGSGNALTGTTMHIWGDLQWGIYADQKSNGINLSNLILEGPTSGNLMNGGYQNVFKNVWIFNCIPNVVTAQQTTATNLSVTINPNGYPINPGMLVSGTGITAGTYITAGSGLTGNFTTTSSTTSSSEAVTLQGPGLSYGDSANSGTEYGSKIDMQISGACPISWLYEGGNNQLDATIINQQGLQTIGSPSSYQSDQIMSWNYVTGLNNMSVSSCGTGSPSVAGSQPNHMYITLGGGSPTSCTVTVGTGNAWPRAPLCHATAANGTAWGMSALSTTSVTFVGSATTTNLYVDCMP